GAPGDLRMDRSLLQPAAVTLGARLPEPDGLRARPCDGGAGGL
ncbi:MAG: hypothetical protein AVDCRST_MAG18-1175, partial [uncultured Thermomicrobiales bacterium]